MKIFLVGAEFFYADEQTDMTKQIAAFRDFAKAPNNKIIIIVTRSNNIRIRLPL